MMRCSSIFPMNYREECYGAFTGPDLLSRGSSLYAIPDICHHPAVNRMGMPNFVPMEAITKKPTVAAAVQQCLQAYAAHGSAACVQALHRRLLCHKVRFPLLEFAAKELCKGLPETQQLAICDEVAALETIGGNVIIGIVLQGRLPRHFDESFERATTCIASGREWYVSDIIGERVYGHALRHMPTTALPALERLLGNENGRVVRGIGAGFHFAVKRGLAQEHVRQVFTLLLSMARIQDIDAKQGMGWAAKTVAKFHPDLVAVHAATLQDPTRVAPWFRTKVNIGLARNAYAQGN